MAQIALRDYLQETEDALSSERVDDALANCQHILKYFPESLEAQRLLGEIYLAQGRLDDAQHAFDWVLTNDPENVIAYCNRALVSEQLPDYDTALDCYQQAYELSRGNSQIRQKFNQLSTRTGQQGFMLSRAGLARIYMRGDLMEQAIAEWDIVLAATPDRLDARTGLLEAYWREGSNEQVVPLARQILRDVPGCEKALLLLAYVSAMTNMSSTQELLQQAAKVDPDLLMAQDLFADMLANHPGDPFLALLQKAPTTIDVTSSADLAALAAPDATASLLASWDSTGGLGSDTTWIKPRTRDQPEKNTPPSLIDWGMNDAGQGLSANAITPAPLSAGSDVPDIMAQLRGDLSLPATWDNGLSQSMPDETSQPEPWQLLQEALQDIDPNLAQHQLLADPSSWDNLLPTLAYEVQSPPDENIAAPVDEAVVANEPVSEPVEAEPMTSWSVSSAKEEKVQAPPAWMNMLSQAERRQLGEAEPVAEPVVSAPEPVAFVPPVQSEPVAPLEVQVPVSSAPVAVPEPVRSQDIVLAHSSAVDDDGESFFSPEWLKSMGATSLETDDEPVADQTPVMSEEIPVVEPPEPEQRVVPEPERVSTPESALPVFDAPTSPTDQSTWMNQLAESAAPAAPSWMEQLAQPAAPSWMEQLTQPAAPSWMEQLSAEPATAEWTPQPSMASFDPWTPQGQEEETVGSPSEVDPPVEQNLVTTLEELEKNLRSKGFISLEPNSLAAIAQAQRSDVDSSEGQLHTAPSEQSTSPYTEPSHSSALAELGGFTQPQPTTPATPVNEPPVMGPPAQPATANRPVVPAEPSWVTALRAVSNVQTPAPVTPATSSDMGAHRDEPAVVAPPLPQQELARAPEVAKQPAPPVQQKPAATTRVDIIPAANARPSVDESSRRAAFPLADPFGGELETTMKRPAVRLQPMQHRPQTPASPPLASPPNRGRASEHAASPPNRGRASEHAASPPNRGRANENAASHSLANGSGNYQERLLKGYQSQLIGDYDDAMQEYRIIVRNAPELLAEVVSNVRALLKLAPTYATGYRVLGDAYMRQGEYLQAMEAYNKALTMTKKAKA